VTDQKINAVTTRAEEVPAPRTFSQSLRVLLCG
jgi:hypothetical protein